MERIKVSSSQISAIGYDEKQSVLEIEFKNGSVYQYPNVPEHIFTDFINSPSKGKFLHEAIKPHYTFARVSGPNNLEKLV